MIIIIKSVGICELCILKMPNKEQFFISFHYEFTGNHNTMAVQWHAMVYQRYFRASKFFFFSSVDS